MSRTIDLTGRKFGRLTVIKRAATNSKSGNARWVCRCDCGNSTVVDSWSLRHGLTRSCGCLHRESSKAIFESNEKLKARCGDATQLLTCDGVPIASIKRRCNNKTGVIGVSFDDKTGLWYARMMIHGRYVLLKSFRHRDEAVEARREAEAKWLPEQYRALS